MKKLHAMFNLKGLLPVVLMTSFGTAVAQTNLEHSINFNGHPLNCATLQGSQDSIPNGMTCGFVEEVEQYFTGPKLKCDPDKPGNSLAALQEGARHLAVSHVQPGLFQHTETTIARINARVNGGSVLQELQTTHPGDASDFYLTYLAIEGTGTRVQGGLSIGQAVQQTANLFYERGYKLPETSGSTQQDILTIFNKNPVLQGHLQCKAQYPQPIWPRYEQ